MWRDVTDHVLMMRDFLAQLIGVGAMQMMLEAYLV